MFQAWTKKIAVVVMVLAGSVFVLTARPIFGQSAGLNSYQAAEQFFSEKSYQLALDRYKAFAAQPGLTAEQKREVSFKIADCSWRSGNSGFYEEASLALKHIVIAPDHDRWWAEANQSLAEFFIQNDRYPHRETIKTLLMSAREFWSGYSDTGVARPRFIRATFELAEYVTSSWGWYFEAPNQNYQAQKEDDLIPPPEHPGPVGIKDLMQDILKVADKAEDKARATFMLATASMNTYDQSRQKDAEKYFEILTKDYSTSEWVDDAYYQLATMYQQHQDFVKAVAAYQALLAKFKPGESQFVDDAQRNIKEITTPVIQPGVGYNFLPDSQVRFSLRWRNVNEAQFTFYKMDLTEELRFDPIKVTAYDRGVDNYARLLKIMVDTRSYERLPVALSFHRTLKDEGKHLWMSEDKGLAEWQMPEDKEAKPDPKSGILAPGAYLLMVKSRETVAYEMVVVSDLGLAVKTAGGSALFFAFDTASGEPKSGAKVKYQYRYYKNGNYEWDEGAGNTDEDGILRVNLMEGDQRYNNQHQLFAVVSDGEKQAFSQSNYYSYYGNRGEFWLYAFADRPAYRPNEEVSFKGTLRRYDGSTFSTPSRLPVKVILYDARNTKVLEKAYTLNDFGSFSDSLTLDEKATLGEYRMELYAGDGSSQLARAALFRLEEYKLPEFTVTVKPRPKGEGQFANAYRLGDKLSLDLDAQYYFGGPVPNAKVEYLIYERPDQHTYYPVRPYEWYYTQDQQRNNYYGNGQLLKKGEAVTDANGKALIEFETDKAKGYDLAYRVEARVVDESRREITATAEIKVTAKSFFICQTPRRNLYRPGDKTEIDIKTMTANDEPVSIEGKVSVSRHWWHEPVVVSSEARSDKAVPAQNLPASPYNDEVLFTKFIKTDAKGQAVFEFSPEQNGYYSVMVTGFDVDGSPIESTVNVYVCDKQANDIGYRYSGLQIIAEKDTYSVGDTLRLMLVSDKPGARVLLSAEAGEIESAQLVRMDGPVKLVEMPVTDMFTPNIFVTAASASDQQIRMHELELIVPPEGHFLNVKVTSDKPVYGPGEKGEFGVEVTNSKGQPVVAELGLSLVDASVFYIQSELAGDIRQFFFGDKRPHSVQLQSSLNQRPYFKVVNKDQPSVDGNERAMNGVDAEKSGAVGRMKSSADDIGVQFAASAPVMSESMSYDRKEESGKKMLAKGGMMNASRRELEPQAAPAELAEAQVRQDFRSTVFWGPSVVTDQQGKAKVSVKFPDPLTTWRATARAISLGTDIGNTTYDVTTKKDIIVRLQAPRFFTERDQVTVSANVHNYTKEKQHIKVTLKALGVDLDGASEVWVDLDPQGEKRVDWNVLAGKAGLAELTAMAQTTTVSDAMLKKYPVIPHGIEKFIARALALKADEGGAADGEVTFDVPKERIKESTSLRLTLSPSMAAAMLDALPYLADYPYGCVEQTMSRFLPAVIVAKTMRDLGFDKKDVDDYLANVLEPRNDPKGHPQRRDDATYSRLNDLARASLDRLYDFQHPDGGWGWWKGGDSDRFMTAYVFWGLMLAKDAGSDVRGDVVSRALQYMDKNLVEEENDPDMLAWMLHAMAYAKYQSQFQDKQIARLWDMREKLNPYTRALFAVGQKVRGREDEAAILARNVVNGVMKDDGDQTAHWGEAGMNYRWSEGGVEATAFSLKALVNIEPQSELIAPAVKWLSLNRRGASWKNTRDTAIAILALADYLKVSGELNPDYDYEVLLNGKAIQQGHVNAANMFTFGRYIDLPAEAVKDGVNTVKVKVNGKGALYLSAYLKYFTLEENITPEGNEIFVERKYFKQSQKETLLKGYVEDWKPLADGDTLQSGDRVKVELDVEAKNNYEYLIFEDAKPAGLEAMELKSGDGYAEALDNNGKATGEKAYLYQEFRDQKAVFFVDKMKQGHYRIAYELRAEIPGDFHAMPDQAHAMYVPEIRANSAEGRMKVVD